MNDIITAPTDKIKQFLKELSFSINKFVDGLETPVIVITKNTFNETLIGVSGCRLVNDSNIELKLSKHKFKINNSLEIIEQKPFEELWINCDFLNQCFVSQAFSKIKEQWDLFDSYSLLHISYKERGEQLYFDKNIVFTDTKIMFRFILNIKNNYDKVKHDRQIIKKGFSSMTDLELASCSIETLTR